MLRLAVALLSCVCACPSKPFKFLQVLKWDVMGILVIFVENSQPQGVRAKLSLLGGSSHKRPRFCPWIPGSFSPSVIKHVIKIPARSQVWSDFRRVAITFESCLHLHPWGNSPAAIQPSWTSISLIVSASFDSPSWMINLTRYIQQFNYWTSPREIHRWMKAWITSIRYLSASLLQGNILAFGDRK